VQRGVDAQQSDERDAGHRQHGRAQQPRIDPRREPCQPRRLERPRHRDAEAVELNANCERQQRE
jgi:hypothetical protein